MKATFNKKKSFYQILSLTSVVGWKHIQDICANSSCVLNSLPLMIIDSCISFHLKRCMQVAIFNLRTDFGEVKIEN